MNSQIIYQAPVAGVKFHQYAKDPALAVGVPVKLKPEPDNPYDADAIEVYHGTFKLGYIARTDTPQLHPYLAANIPLNVVVSFLDVPARLIIISVIVDKEHIITPQ